VLRSALLVLALLGVVPTFLSCAPIALFGTVDVRETFEHATLPRVEIRVVLPASQRRYAASYVDAVRAALRLFGEWYGPWPSGSLTLASAGVPGPYPPEAVVIDTALVTPSAANARQQDVFRAVAARYWMWRGGPGPDDELRAGLAQFSADRAARVEFARGALVHRRYFLGVVPWVVRGVPVGSPPPGAGRATRALLTLERYLGWPALQQALSHLHTRGVEGTLQSQELIALLQDITARDLRWLGALFDGSVAYDYGVEAVRGHASGGVDTMEVVVRRHGNGVFVGVPVLVTFADGEEIRERWDGTDVEARFIYESAAPIRAAVVDPDRMLVVDARPANNRLEVGDAVAHRASLAWAAWWAAWLQDRLLIWSMLI
jgi:hypothetical protein